MCLFLKQDTEAEESNQVYETVAATLSEMTVSDVYCLFWNDVRSIEVARETNALLLFTTMEIVAIL